MDVATAQAALIAAGHRMGADELRGVIDGLSRWRVADGVTRAGRCGGTLNDAGGTEGSQSQKVGWLGGSALHRVPVAAPSA